VKGNDDLALSLYRQLAARYYSHYDQVEIGETRGGLAETREGLIAPVIAARSRFGSKLWAYLHSPKHDDKEPP
jgi:hypothetical protein